MGKVDGEKLLAKYVELREAIKPLEQEKNEIQTQLKAWVGDRIYVPSKHFKVTYDYDKDKEIEIFDEETFKIKEPKRYEKYLEAQKKADMIRKKYVKKQTQKGARKLLIERLTQGEE